MLHLHHMRSVRHCLPARRSAWVLAAALLVGLAATSDVYAQRPFRMADPFYRSETARRAFYDRLAFTTELSYRPLPVTGSDGVTAGADPLGLRFRLDYELGDNFDVSGIVDAFSVGNGRSLALSWVILKYYRYLDEADYAFRLAIDPASDGRAGFPQVDLAFLYTSFLSPLFSSDFALGVRRVNIGYFETQPAPVQSDLQGPYANVGSTILSTRAYGTELHTMLNYNVHFDPAGSNVFATLLAEGGRYDLVETLLEPTGRGPVGPVDNLDNTRMEGEASDGDFRGGVVWLRAGAEFNRPSYQAAPFIAAPLKQWSLGDEEPVVARLHIGVRFMVR